MPIWNAEGQSLLSPISKKRLRDHQPGSTSLRWVLEDFCATRLQKRRSYYMKCNCRGWLAFGLIVFSFFFVLNGCATIGGTGGNTGDEHPSAAKNGPPAHAPAHGYRAKHQYRYYPSCSVYFDIGRSVYFYLEGDNWRAGVRLPNHLRVRLGDYVVVEMDTDRPYLHYESHKEKYPPGQLKKSKPKKWVKSK